MTKVEYGTLTPEATLLLRTARKVLHLSDKQAIAIVNVSFSLAYNRRGEVVVEGYDIAEALQAFTRIVSSFGWPSL